VKIIWADFASQDAEGRVRLDTTAGVRDLKAQGAKASDRVCLTDGAVTVMAVLELGALARADWTTLRVV
jgi:hypothetical protein